MEPTTGYFNMVRVKQAMGMQYKLVEYNSARKSGDPELGSTELRILAILAKRMGDETTSEGEIKNGCRPSLETLEADSMMERQSIASSIVKLVTAGFLQKTMEGPYNLNGQLTKEGRRLQSLGLLQDEDVVKYLRKPMGRPKLGSAGKREWGEQWDHCVYHLVPEVWDSVIFKGKKDKSEPAIAHEISVADQAVLESLGNEPAAEVPAAAPESKSAISNEDFDTLLKIVNKHFCEHKVWDLSNHRDLVGNAIHELGRRALEAGHLYRGVEFLDWLYVHRRSTYDFLENSEKFGGALMKIITDNWDQFIDSGYKDDQYYDHSTEESAGTPDDVEQADYEKYVSDLLINHFTKHETAPEIPDGMCVEIVRRSLCSGGIHQAGDFVRWVRGECPRYSIDEVNEQLDSLWWDFRHPNAVDELE